MDKKISRAKLLEAPTVAGVSEFMFHLWSTDMCILLGVYLLGF